jgi:hypothetical protein
LDLALNSLFEFNTHAARRALTRIKATTQVYSGRRHSSFMTLLPTDPFENRITIARLRRMITGARRIDSAADGLANYMPTVIGVRWERQRTG